MHKLFFRLLILASFVCNIGGVMLERYPLAQVASWEASITHRGEGAFPWREWLAEHFQTQLTAETLLIILGALYTLSLIGYVGLFVFSRLGRFVYLSVLVIHIALTLAAGLSVLSPQQQALANIGLILDGALLALAYASPVAVLFQHVKATASVLPSPLDTEATTPQRTPAIFPQPKFAMEEIAQPKLVPTGDAMPPLPQI